MREIIFRGKSIHDDKWHEGLLISVNIESDSNIDDRSKYTHAIIPLNVEFYRGELGGFEFVIPETIGQYTGFKDLNGNRIFEDDIVKRRVDREAQINGLMYVAWDNGGWHLFNLEDDEDFLSNWCANCYYRGEEIGGCYVVGNVHDVNIFNELFGNESDIEGI